MGQALVACTTLHYTTLLGVVGCCNTSLVLFCPSLLSFLLTLFLIKKRYPFFFSSLLSSSSWSLSAFPRRLAASRHAGNMGLIGSGNETPDGWDMHHANGLLDGRLSYKC